MNSISLLKIVVPACIAIIGGLIWLSKYRRVRRKEKTLKRFRESLKPAEKKSSVEADPKERNIKDIFGDDFDKIVPTKHFNHLQQLKNMPGLGGKKLLQLEFVPGTSAERDGDYHLCFVEDKVIKMNADSGFVSFL